ncbi:chemotaxis protein [Labrenzia aggregata]|uniref:Chemotaxis protein n=2 Tax=Roseibium aggregatum TaxID=187304 RepID=A0A926NUX2_9HYPH|nr:chemotaxis protein [Roseibium aggregatum]
MQTMEAQTEPDSIGELEYRTLEQTLMESDRGRRFLAEFVKRNQTPETQEILAAIHRLEKTMTRQRKVPDLDRIRLDIAEMHDAIERTKLEIANIKQEGEHTNRFTDASHELDAIVTQTEGATQSILEAAEQIQEKAWTLREQGAEDSICDDIDAKATEIFMACSFQDLTGQRTTKVVQVLRYLESRINLMISIWGIEDHEADESAGPEDTRPDAHLLNGPQREGKGVSQNNVDELMAVSGDVFDAALEETRKAHAAPAEADIQPAAESAGDQVASEADIEALMAADDGAGDIMDAAAIDDMFGPNASDDDEDVSLADAAADDDIPPVEAGAADAELDASDFDAEVLDEAAIDRLFDAEATEAAADEEWEQAEDESNAAEAKDPLEDLSEAERQALFN